MTTWARIAAGGALAAAAVSAIAGGETFRWPVAEGWRSETIPFPLEFAKDLPYSGVEELRFAPGMFKPDQDGYWSYAFVWWLEGKPALDAPALEHSLTRYFAGLITDVAKEKGYPIDPARFSASIHPVTAAGDKLGHAVRAYAGTVDSYDAFATGKPLVLNLEVWVWDCPQAGRRVALVLASPKPGNASIWSALRERRAELVCHGGAGK